MGVGRIELLIPTKPQKLRKSIVKFTSDIKKSIRKSNIKYALDSYLIVNFRLDLKINWKFLIRNSNEKFKFDSKNCNLSLRF